MLHVNGFYSSTVALATEMKYMAKTKESKANCCEFFNVVFSNLGKNFLLLIKVNKLKIVHSY